MLPCFYMRIFFSIEGIIDYMRKYVLIWVLMEYFYNTINKIICIPKYQIVYPQ